MPPRIMVVEDQNILAGEIQRKLEKLGYEAVVTVSSGEEAMMKVVQLKPDVVLLDAGLKGSVSGVETADRIKKLLGIPVIFFAEHFDDDTNKLTGAVDSYGRISGPFDEKYLQIAIEAALLKTNTERELRESETNLKHAASLAHLGYWERDIRTNEVTWSDEHHRIFGYSPGEVTPTFELLLKHVHEEDKERLLQTLADSTEKHTPYNIEFRIVRHDGVLRWLQTRAELSYDSNDNPVKLTGTSLDITEMKLLEHKMLEEKERAEAATKLKDQFVSLVAHDLRTPLNALSGFLKLIRGDMRDGDKEEIEKLLDISLKNAEIMSSLIEDVLNINKIRSGKIMLYPIFQDAYLLIQQLITHIRPMADQKGVVIRNTIPSKTRLFADPILFYEVLQNLVTNAIKFTKAGGCVTVFSSPNRPGTISISDDGVGIPADRLKDIFVLEKKTSTAGTAGEEGSGYGLPLSMDIMRAHGGEITAESTIGKGSVFHASLPVVRPVVLLVDDEKVTRAIYSQYLKLLDVDVVEAEDGARALELLKQVQAHIIVSDLIMPVMDGYEFLRRIRNDPRYEKTPFIVVTGKPDLESGERIFKLGANDFVGKRAAPEDFLARVGRYLG